MKLFLPALVLLFASQLSAQVTLTTSPYTQDFNSLSSGLPSGWRVMKLATNTFIGTDTTLNNPSKSLWNGTGRGYKDCASATGLTSAATSTEQDNSTNRALAVRQIGSFGDSGAAFVFQAVNTTGKSNFQLTFKLQSLDNTSPRTTTWVVDYATGANPSAFTTIATSPTPLTTGNNTFSNTDITVNFGTALDNISDVVTIRLTTYVKSTGSGARATTAIDDWNLSWSGTSGIGDIRSRDSYVKIASSTSQAISLQFSKSVNSKVQLQLTNINGQVVYSKALSKVTEGQTETIPVAALARGIYFVSILSKDGNFGTKISR